MNKIQVVWVILADGDIDSVHASEILAHRRVNYLRGTKKFGGTLSVHRRIVHG